MTKQSSGVPQHIAIIMDGNRRWAKQQGLELIKGHRYVAEERIEGLVDYAMKQGVKYMTLWAFSTENWQRSEQEVSDLMQLFRDMFHRSYDRLMEKGVRVAHIGDMGRFSQDIQDGVGRREKESENNQRFTVAYALNYGGHDEILRANKTLLLQAKKEHWSDEKIKSLDEKIYASYLDTKKLIELPDPDLLIRTGGEKRLSGFMSWQIAYTELYFTDVLMPDFNEAQLQKALDDYASRQRRFGK